MWKNNSLIICCELGYSCDHPRVRGLRPPSLHDRLNVQRAACFCRRGRQARPPPRVWVRTRACSRARLSTEFPLFRTRVAPITRAVAPLARWHRIQGGFYDTCILRTQQGPPFQIIYFFLYWLFNIYINNCLKKYIKHFDNLLCITGTTEKYFFFKKKLTFQNNGSTTTIFLYEWFIISMHYLIQKNIYIKPGLHDFSKINLNSHFFHFLTVYKFL